MDIKLPNVRNLFLPDVGHVIVDCDLSGADAQVVAWEADEPELKEAFRKGLDVHTFNGETIWGAGFRPKEKRTPTSRFTMRDEMKRAVHLTNYGGSARTNASVLGWKVIEMERFQKTWFEKRPGILRWHRRYERQLQTTRTITNAFGYRRVYFDRVDALLPQALAWTPQSTVGLVASRGGCNLYKNIPWLTVLLQVHDSLVFQVPYHRFTPKDFEIIHRHLQVPIPYPDPLLIPWGLAASFESWGKCKKLKWDFSDCDEAQFSQRVKQRLPA